MCGKECKCNKPCANCECEKTVRVFVYGELLSGLGLEKHIRHMIVKRDTKAAYVLGGLFIADGADYPVADPSDDDLIEGELLTIRADCLPILDSMHQVPHMYERKMTSLLDGTEAYIYWNVGIKKGKKMVECSYREYIAHKAV